MMKVFTYYHDLKEMPPYVQLCVEIMQKTFGKTLALYERENFVREFSEVREEIWEVEREDGHIVNTHALRSDYVRAHLLKKYGGIWIDADTVVVNNFLKHVFPMFDLFDYVGRKNEVNLMAMNFMGSRKDGRVINQLLHYQDIMLDTKSKISAGSFFGSRLLTKAVNAVGEKHISIIPESMIAPINFKNHKDYFREDLQLSEFALEFLFCFQLYSRAFPKEMKEMSKEEFLNQRWFVSRLIKYVYERAE